MTIRRNYRPPDGVPQWILISQVEHARLSGELARHWGAFPFAPLVPCPEVTDAIAHHDDGWAQWERGPGIDAETGRPLAFTEMPAEVGLPIWTVSIERALALGNLAAWMIAGHFSSLLEGSTTAKSETGRRWLAKYRDCRAGWLRHWMTEEPAAHTPRVAERALGHLQFFDAISLWLCCAEQVQPATMTPPGGPSLMLTPGADTTAGEQIIRVAPWPLAIPSLTLSVPGRAIPAKRYGSTAELLAAAADVRIGWRVVGDG